MIFDLSSNTQLVVLCCTMAVAMVLVSIIVNWRRTYFMVLELMEIIRS